MSAPELAAIEAEIGQRLDARDHSGAATVAIRRLGPQILGYLSAVLRDAANADEAFSSFCEDLWRGIAQFRREATFRTWAYTLAWHAAQRLLSDPFRKRARVLATGEAEALAAEIRSTTSLHLRASSQDALSEIRATLDPAEQTLLILRVDRDLAWSDIATVMAEEGTPVSEAALRKRFERLKEKIKREASARGVLLR